MNKVHSTETGRAVIAQMNQRIGVHHAFLIIDGKIHDNLLVNLNDLLVHEQ